MIPARQSKKKRREEEVHIVLLVDPTRRAAKIA